MPLWTYKYNQMLPYRKGQIPGGTGGAVYHGLAPDGGNGEEWDDVGFPTSWTSFTGPGWNSNTYHTDDSLMGNGNFLVAGSPSSGSDWAKEWDPTDLTYTLITGTQPVNVTAGKLVKLHDGTVMGLRTVRGRTHVYDPDVGDFALNCTLDWSPPNVCSARLDGSRTSLCRTAKVGAEAIYFCGRDRSTGGTRAYVQTYNQSSQEWTSKSNFPLTVRSLSSAYLHTGPQAGKILVGGGGSATVNSYKWYFYDVEDDSYTATTDNDSSTYLNDCAGVIQLGNGKVYLIGGNNTVSSGATKNRVVEFDVEAETWANYGTNPLPFATDNTECSVSHKNDGTIILHRSGTSYYGNIVPT